MEENEIRERIRHLPEVCKEIGIGFDENCEIDVNEGTIRIFEKRQDAADRTVINGWTIIYQERHCNSQYGDNQRFCNNRHNNNRRELEKKYFAF